MALDMTTFDAALKVHYTDKRVENMVYKKNPLLALVEKDEDMTGKSFVIPNLFANPQGRSALIGTAITKATTSSSSIKAFNLTRVKDYGVCTIDNETIMASSNDTGAFMKATTTEIDGIINSLSRSLAIALYRTGSGSLGTVGSLPGATNIAILTNVDDITNWEVGMDIVGALTDLGGVLRSATTLNVTAIDRTKGQITVSAAFSTVGIVVGDSLFAAGDRQNAASPVAQKVSGLEAWVPAATPAATAFFGVDRSSDTRLGGLRYNGAGYPLEEVLTEAATFAAREGATIDTFYCNFAKWSALSKALGSKVNYDDVKANADIMFRSVRIHGPNGTINVMPDMNCPNNRVFGLQQDTWTLYSLGKCPKVLDTDGQTMLRQATADGVEVRYGYYAQLGCTAPGFNINVQV